MNCSQQKLFVYHGQIQLISVVTLLIKQASLWQKRRWNRFVYSEHYGNNGKPDLVVDTNSSSYLDLDGFSERA